MPRSNRNRQLSVGQQNNCTSVLIRNELLLVVYYDSTGTIIVAMEEHDRTHALEKSILHTTISIQRIETKQMKDRLPRSCNGIFQSAKVVSDESMNF